ncbi:MAG: hypothetical protein M1559_03510 [Candidatus Marsarchaeota archaeon]|nr:hypothetical protein [Candidatus Marsarchaeota archaeon]
MRNFIFPGEVVAERQLRMDNTYIENGVTRSCIFGVFDDERRTLIPLEGVWKPRSGDIVVGVVNEVTRNAYRVKLTDHFEGIYAPGKMEGTVFKVGEVMEAELGPVGRRPIIELERPRRLSGGILINVKPVRIPRIIGREDTMIRQIIDITKCRIAVGRNGIVWISGKNLGIAMEAVLKIEREAHVPGLTNRIKLMLEERIKENKSDSNGF